MELDRRTVSTLIQQALAEDVGLGDITTLTTVGPDDRAKGRIWAKEPLVVCGLPIAQWTFEALEPTLSFQPASGIFEGREVERGTTLATVEGSARAILTAERVALNFMQRLAGIASQTRAFVRALGDAPTRISDTRKTVPGLRMLDKYAVRTGGGANHRWSLDSGVLIKDNHLLAAGGVRNAVAQARAAAPHTLRVEVECKRLYQVREAVESGADAVLLDNMDLDTLREAIAIVDGRLFVEVSGGIVLDTVASRAVPGADLISTGSLTHSVRASDISLDFQWVQSQVGEWDLRRFAECQSTNDEARAWVRTGPAPARSAAVLTESQTAGRGRDGRSWHAEHGGFLALTAIVSLRVTAERRAGLALVTGLALCRALEANLPADRVQLKWPNDVLVDGKKLAGVLCEWHDGTDGPGYAVLGIGLNVNVPANDFPDELRATATSLSEATGVTHDREALVRRILRDLTDGVRRYERDECRLPTDALKARMRWGAEVEVRAPGTPPWRGKTVGLDDDGALLVAREGGEARRVIVGDVIPVSVPGA